MSYDLEAFALAITEPAPGTPSLLVEYLGHLRTNLTAAGFIRGPELEPVPIAEIIEPLPYKDVSAPLQELKEALAAQPPSESIASDMAEPPSEPSTRQRRRGPGA